MLRILLRVVLDALVLWVSAQSPCVLAALISSVRVLAGGGTRAAHRGGPPPAPENTPAALERAIEEGADFSEIDVQLTGDGTPGNRS